MKEKYVIPEIMMILLDWNKDIICTSNPNELPFVPVSEGEGEI